MTTVGHRRKELRKPRIRGQEKNGSWDQSTGETVGHELVLLSREVAAGMRHFKVVSLRYLRRSRNQWWVTCDGQQRKNGYPC